MTTLEAEQSPEAPAPLAGPVDIEPAEIEPGHEQPTPPRPPRFPAFDGLRAIAAGTVVGVHVGFVSGLSLRNTSVGVYTARLEIGVAVFFLISGFLLYRPFTVSHLAGQPRPKTGAFWIRRLLRIVPAYWVALFVTTAVLHPSAAETLPGWHEILSHYLFVQIYWPSQIFYGITQSWTLCVEMSFYLLLPLYAVVIARRSASQPPGRRLGRELTGLGILVAISLAWRFWVLANQQGHSAVFGVMPSWLPGDLDLFSLGMLLAVLSAWFHLRDSEPGWMSRRWFPLACWLLAGVTFWGVSHLGLPRTAIYTKSDIDIARQILYGAFGFFLLLPAVFGPQHRGLIRRGLQSWPMASLGVISYGVYLWHQTLLDTLVKYYPDWFGMKVFFNVGFWGMFGEVFGAAVVVAAVSYFVIEKPALRAKRFFSWFDASAKAPGSTAAAPAPAADPVVPAEGTGG